jgi:hypothetical protein
MATRKLFPMTRSEHSFWRQAYLTAELSVLLQEGKRVSPQGAAHLAAEYANASVLEDRRARAGDAE